MLKPKTTFLWEVDRMLVVTFNQYPEIIAEVCTDAKFTLSMPEFM